MEKKKILLPCEPISKVKIFSGSCKRKTLVALSLCYCQNSKQAVYRDKNYEMYASTFGAESVFVLPFFAGKLNTLIKSN